MKKYKKLLEVIETILNSIYRADRELLTRLAYLEEEIDERGFTPVIACAIIRGEHR